MNEILIVLSVLLIYGTVLLSYRLFGKSALFALSALFTVLANIEVLMVVRAFGIEQTLGNILFAATFLITDILSECESKKDASRAVSVGILASLFFLVLSQIWIRYIPSAESVGGSAIPMLFQSTPRLVLSGLLVYAVVQKLDVFLYHKFWHITHLKTGDKKRFLWLRNNGATLISQLVNVILFNLGAFAGVYSAGVLIKIMISAYIISILAALLDTPIVYLARRIHEKTE